jgi:arginine decarboxylase
MSEINEKNDWTTEDACDFYNIDRWGLGHMGVNHNGNLCIYPERNATGPSIDIMEVIAEMKQQGIRLPAVIRFQDILRNQVIRLNKVFNDSIHAAKYQGRYFGVFPVKVNQLREVVEEILDAGFPYDYGLEAGSKTELLAVLALNMNKNALTVLNGYKDQDFLQLALLGSKLGRKMIVVIEKYSELPQLLDLAKSMNVEPIIGIRARLSVKGSGRWAGSSGDRAKFGLSVSEILAAVELLKQTNNLSALKLFHFHVGSQVTDIQTIKDAITEGGRLYCKLVRMGVPLEYFDVGGGMGVDYLGTRMNCHSSMNYSPEEYAADVVYMLKQICDMEEVVHPHIVSETGRGISAHHSCVVANVFDSIDVGGTEYPSEKTAGEHPLVDHMREIERDLAPENIQEAYNDAFAKRDECLSAFRLGILGLEDRAKIETLYWQILKKVYKLSLTLDFIPEELRTLEEKLASQYLTNFSIFQSAPDSWGIDQILPVVPLQRLNERPTRKVSIADITCDSDGKIDKFIGEEETSKTVALHELRKGEEYHVGIFLTGAYQDIMGDTHNFMGRLNEIHVFCDDEDPTDFYIEEFIEGESGMDILSSFQYSPIGMAQTIKKEIDKQVARGKLRPKEGVQLTDFYEKCLKSYSYIQLENGCKISTTPETAPVSSVPETQ